MAEDRQYRRNPAASETEIDGEIFLVEPDTEEVFYLDRMGSALWRLLAEPATFDDIMAVFRAAFPAVPRDRLEQDLTQALDMLLERGLALEVC